MIIREKGTDRRKFLKGEVQKYQWIDKGSSYLLAEPLAAILLGQLEMFDSIQHQRGIIWNKYLNFFKDRVALKNIKLPYQHNVQINSYHMFYLEFPNSIERSYFSSAASESGIQTTFHYVPLHSSIAGSKYSSSLGDFSQTERISSTLLRFPIYPNMDSALWGQLEKSWELYMRNSKSLRQ
jgi:dTDP-4-amino-4,6-dideoxygalactose transaminase